MRALLRVLRESTSCVECGWSGGGGGGSVVVVVVVVQAEDAHRLGAWQKSFSTV